MSNRDQSVHDNIIYAYSVLCEERMIVLHTHYCDNGGNEFSDVVFRDVTAHHIEGVLDSNILFDIEKVAIEDVLQNNEALFKRLSPYGWPRIEYSSLSELTKKLNEAAVRAFVISSSYGLMGWVLSKSMEFIQRPEVSTRKSVTNSLER